MAETKVVGHVINCEEFRVAILKDETAKTYDMPMVEKLMSIKVDTDTSTESLSGDGSPTDLQTGTGKTTIEAEVNKIGIENQAKILGHRFDAATGAIVYGKDDVVPYVACGFKYRKSNGSYQYVWYYKGKFEEISDDVKQIEDGKVSFSTPKIKGTFIYRSDGSKGSKWDEDAGTVPAKILEKVTEPPAKPTTPGV